MRADRLVAILLLLQRHGQVTAAQVAEELEISERTARRDLEALGVAGLPVYSTPGRGGGWRLLGDGRTDLSGFSADEARALFMIAGTATVPTPALQSALRKLTRALPETLRDSAEAATTLLILEPAGWDADSTNAPPLLDVLQEAVLGGRQADLAYRDGTGAPSHRRVHPLGLVNKGRRWYLIAGTAAGLRTFRIDRISEVTPTTEPVERPADFDLAETWAQVGSHVRSLRAELTAHGRVRDDLAPIIRHLFGRGATIGTLDDGWRPFEVTAWNVAEVAGRLAGLGAAVRVDGPPEVIERLRLVATELAELYPADPAA